MIWFEPYCGLTYNLKIMVGDKNFRLLRALADKMHSGANDP